MLYIYTDFEHDHNSMIQWFKRSKCVVPVYDVFLVKYELNLISITFWPCMHIEFVIESNSRQTTIIDQLW